jgi:hypothetical protein
MVVQRGAQDCPDTAAARPASLSDKHWRELTEASAIPPEIVLEDGARSEHREGWLKAHNLPPLPGLLLPVHQPDGSNGRYVLKPDQPRLDEQGKPRKYESQRGQPNVLHVPTRCRARITDPNVDLFITEGWKKAAALAGIGKTVVGISGVWNWQKDHALIPDWQAILPSLAGRRVFIVFDSDAATNKHVRLAEDTLAGAFLLERGADAFILRIPPEPDGSKNGADDYIARHGVAAFDRLVADTVRAARDEVRDLRRNVSLSAAVIRNADLRAEDRLVALAAIHESAHLDSAGRPAPFAITRARLGSSGTKPSRVTAALKVLTEGSEPLFAVERPRRTTEQGPRTELRLTPLHATQQAMLEHAARLKPDYPEWGGKPPVCPEHPHADVIVRTVVICAECGQVLDERERTLGGAPPQTAIENARRCATRQSAPGYRAARTRPPQTQGEQVEAHGLSETPSDRPEQENCAPTTTGLRSSPHYVHRGQNFCAPVRQEADGCPGCGAPLAPGEPSCPACFEMVNLVRAPDPPPTPPTAPRDLFDELAEEASGASNPT